MIAAIRPSMRGQVPQELPRAYQTRMMKSQRGEVFTSACGECCGRVNTHQSQTLNSFGRPEFLLWSPSLLSLTAGPAVASISLGQWSMMYFVSMAVQSGIDLLGRTLG